MKLYSIKNTQTVRFNPPFVARDDDDAIETCRKAIIAGRDSSLLVELDNLQLCRVGTFSAVTGDLSVEAFCPCCIVEMGDISLPQHIQDVIEKLKSFEPINLNADLKEVKE